MSLKIHKLPPWFQFCREHHVQDLATFIDLQDKLNCQVTNQEKKTYVFAHESVGLEDLTVDSWH